MSYEKLKNIKISGDGVNFEHKSNNDTAPYRQNSTPCSIQEFLHAALGNVFQFGNSKLNAIVKECKSNLKDQDKFWWNYENWGILSDKISQEDRNTFFHYCYKLKLYGNSK